MLRPASVLMGAFVAAACAGSPPPPPEAAAATPDQVVPGEVPAAPATSAQEEPSDFPRELVAGPGAGRPAIYLGAESDAAAIGYISEGVVIEIAGAPERDRIPIRVRGGLRVRGYLPTDRLAARVQRRGRIQGTPLYVGPNDLVRVIGPVDGETMRVEGQLRLRQDGPDGPKFTGTFPTVGLGGRVVRVSSENEPPGTPHQPEAGAEIEVFDQPDGEVIYTVPAITPPAALRLAAERDDWRAVLVGVGPYVAGYTRATLRPSQPPVIQATAPSAPAGEVPRRLREDASLPLYRLPAGTRIVFNGVTVAALDRDGYAREMARHEAENEVDVFVAADDDVAVRGMISADVLASAERVNPPSP